jgi:hypothetical protein
MPRSCLTRSLACIIGVLGAACFGGGDEPITADDAETGEPDDDGDGEPDDDDDGEPGDGEPGDGEPGDDDGEPGDGDPGDGDPGDGDPGDGDPGDGDPGDGDPGDGGPGPDSDGDGIPDAIDNCPHDPNPNQLDFNGNGVGNVCDTLVFTNVAGKFDSNAIAKSNFGGCNIPVVIEVTSGEVHVQLDDDAALAAFEVVELQIADLPPHKCQINFLMTAMVSLSDFVVINNGDSFPVSVAHSQAAHDAGTISGESDGPHPMLSTANLEAAIGNDPPVTASLELDGSLPVLVADINGGGAAGSLVWSDNQHVIATDQIVIDQPIKATIDFEFRGLVGTLDLLP